MKYKSRIEDQLFRDKLEAMGAVVHLRNGSYGLIEIKLGGEKLIEEGAKTLTALCLYC